MCGLEFFKLGESILSDTVQYRLFEAISILTSVDIVVDTKDVADARGK